MPGIYQTNRGGKKDVGRKEVFEDQLEVKAENNQMAEAAKISEEETENTDNSEKKDSLGTDLES